MAHLAYVWELGSNFGHLANFSAVSRELRRRGHSISVIARRVDGYHLFLPRDSVRVYPAPRPDGGTPGNFVPRTWSDIVVHTGFANPNTLADLLSSWRALFQSIQPDLVIHNFSAIASLASHSLSLPSVNMGLGYGMPPKTQPLPALQPQSQLAENTRHKLDAAVFDVACATLASLDLPPIDSDSNLP